VIDVSTPIVRPAEVVHELNREHKAAHIPDHVFNKCDKDLNGSPPGRRTPTAVLSA
jgi:hypothetical protein